MLIALFSGESHKLRIGLVGNSDWVTSLCQPGYLGLAHGRFAENYNSATLGRKALWLSG